ncbi:MAG: hypothetical protein ACREM2_08685 [Vulcanimicrobiaceae bacterium]
MKLTLDRRQRALLLFLSAACYLAWFAGVGEGQAQSLLGFAASSLAPAPAPRVVPVGRAIRRDPFAGAPNVGGAARRAQAIAPEAPAAVPEIAAAFPPLGGPSFGDSSPQSDYVLRATITGRSPVAYVAHGASMQIVRIGDILDGRRVAAIALDGIVFADGTQLVLPSSAGQAVAPPRNVTPKASAARLDLATLKRLLQNLHASAPPPAAPGPSPTASYPTAGPLPTPNARGLAPGVNPTPDLSGPTPYPYPYPYAPYRFAPRRVP